MIYVKSKSLINLLNLLFTDISMSFLINLLDSLLIFVQPHSMDF